MTVLSYKGLYLSLAKKAFSKDQDRWPVACLTVRHIGGGNKEKYRIIDFKRQKLDVYAEVKTLEYDPNRSLTSLSFSTRTARRHISSLPRV